MTETEIPKIRNRAYIFHRSCTKSKKKTSNTARPEKHGLRNSVPPEASQHSASTFCSSKPLNEDIGNKECTWPPPILMACFIRPVERISFSSLSFPWAKPLYCDYKGHTHWLFVGHLKEQDYQNPFFPWENFVFHVIFPDAEAQSNQNMSSNESMGHPISWGNGITLSHIYLEEPNSETLHFWSTFRS